MVESRIYFIQYKASHSQERHNTRYTELRRVHRRLKSDKVIYEGLLRIMCIIWCEEALPSNIIHFDSVLDEIMHLAWAEQRAIGWDQILKDRLSKNWGKAQGMFYWQRKYSLEISGPQQQLKKFSSTASAYGMTGMLTFIEQTRRNVKKSNREYFMFGGKTL